MDLVAAFGIGSTNFRYAAATTDGTVRVGPRVEPTRPTELAAQVTAAVTGLREETDRPVDGVSVTTPGLVDDDAGVVRSFDTPDGETIDRIELGPRLESELGLGLVLANDCNASALGEWHFGVRTDESCVVHLTVGTGIGGGVVEDGRLLRGESGQAGEFGLLPVAPDSGMGSCGVTGAWEAVCSGRGIPRYVSRRLAETDAETRLDPDADLSAPDVFAARDDPFVADCLDRIARYNAAGVGAVCNAVNPGLVTLGGGVALNHGEWVREGIESRLAEFCFVDPPAVRTTGLGDDVGLYGALATYRERATSRRAVSPPEPTEGTTD